MFGFCEAKFPVKGDALKRHCKCHFCKLIMIILEKRTICSLKTKIKVFLVNCHFIYYIAIAGGTKLAFVFVSCFLVILCLFASSFA